jgi:hypothetical protein
MRMRMVSALCVLALLICSPRPAAAQSNPATSQMPQAPKLSDLPKSAESGAVDTRAEFTSALTSQLKTNKELFLLNGQQHAANGMGMQAPVETSSCAHILIYKAPVVDSKMIIAVPTESTVDKPKLEGLQVCREDVRMAAMTPQRRPLVSLKPNLGLLLVRIRP